MNKAPARRDNLRYVLQFMLEVVRENRHTGAIGPSSKALAELITDLAGVAAADSVVEFGPGTGVFTEVIRRKLRPESRFVAIEINPEFVKATRRRCPDVRVVHGDVRDTRRHLAEAGSDDDRCDVIVSGLPWTRFSDDLQDRLLEAAHDALRPGGRFVTFAYSVSPLFPAGRNFFNAKLPEKFPGLVRSGHVWKNFPPCVVYSGVKD